MMKFYYFDIANKKIDEFNGEVQGVSEDFKQYEDKSFGIEEIYYKVDNDNN